MDESGLATAIRFHNLHFDEPVNFSNIHKQKKKKKKSCQKCCVFVSSKVCHSAQTSLNFLIENLPLITLAFLFLLLQYEQKNTSTGKSEQKIYLVWKFSIFSRLQPPKGIFLSTNSRIRFSNFMTSCTITNEHQTPWSKIDFTALVNTSLNQSPNIRLSTQAFVVKSKE